MAKVKEQILKAAVIGCGRIGAWTKKQAGDPTPASYYPTNHCAAVRGVAGVRLTAVCDVNPDAAKQAAKFHRVENIYTDYKKMVRDQRPDIISIATRMPGRSEIIVFAAGHGVKAMHIEKPRLTTGDAAPVYPCARPCVPDLYYLKALLDEYGR